MAIQTSKAVTEIKVLNSGSKDVVAEFNLRVVSYDDSDQDRTTIDSEGTFELDTTDRTSSSDGWVDYESLTQAKLEEWGGPELSEWLAAVTDNQASWINSVLNPPAPAKVDKALPF